MARKIEQAFVLGAGLGTRLKALTAARPKPLIPICQKPLITFAFDHLIASGVEAFVVNSHHRAEAYAGFFPEARYRDRPIRFRHEPDILETAGGIKNVEDLVGAAPFVVYNGDILTDLPLAEAIEHHHATGNEVTMILRSTGGPLQVAFDPATGRILDIGQRLGIENGPGYLFSGVYLVDPAFLRRIPPGEKISVVPIFLAMIREGARLGGIVLDQGHWWDLGTREQYLAVHRFFAGTPGGLAFPIRKGWPEWIDPTAEVAGDAILRGATAIGHGCQVEAGVTLEDCVLWPGAQITRDSTLRQCIVTGSRPVSGSHTGVDF